VHGSIPVFDASHTATVQSATQAGGLQLAATAGVAGIVVGSRVTSSVPNSHSTNCNVVSVVQEANTTVAVTTSSPARVAIPVGATCTFASTTGYVTSGTLTSNTNYRTPAVTSATKYPISDDYYAMSTEGSKTRWGYGVQFQRNWNPELYDVRSPKFALNVQSENWTFSPPANSGIDLDHLLSTVAASGRACIPMWIKPAAIAAGLYHPNLLNVPFVGFIVARTVDPVADNTSVRDQIRIPNPGIGEFFGLSTSHSDRGTSQIITTQKNGNFKQGSDGVGYPTSSQTQCALAYFPFVTFGADDPSTV